MGEQNGEKFGVVSHDQHQFYGKMVEVPQRKIFLGIIAEII
jgi:hypothetical protein